MRWLFVLLLVACPAPPGALVRLPRGGGGVALVSIAVTPDPIDAATGADTQLTATGTYSDASTANLTSAVTWASSDTGKATIVSGSAGGLLSGVAVGATNITATLGAVTSPAVVATVTSSLILSRARMVTCYNSSIAVGVPFSVALPIWIPDDVTRVRFLISNRDCAQGSIATGVAGCKAAVYKSLGTADGQVTGSPIFEDAAVTIPTLGADYSTGWVTVGSARGSDGNIVLAYSVPTGQDLATNNNSTYGRRSITSAAVNPLPGDMAESYSFPFTVAVEYETAAVRLMGEGDSLSQAYDPFHGAGTTFQGSFLYRLGPENGYAVDNNGIPGSTLEQWNDTVGRPNYKLGQRPDGTTAVVELSINDLPTLAGADNAAKAATFISRVGVQVVQLQNAGVVRIMWINLPPSLAYVANDAVRVLINASLPGTLGAGNVVDASAVVTDPGDATALNPAYDVGDGTHWNGAGQAAVKAALLAKL
jgi:lysophospholipase L1-like esterase